MGPVGAAGYAMIASAALLAVLAGVLGGATASALGGRLLWVGLLASTAYLAAAVFWASGRLTAAFILGIPPVILTLMTTWLTARHLMARAGLGRVWATFAGVGVALLVGCLWMLLFRHSLETPIALACMADACLVAIHHRMQRESA